MDNTFTNKSPLSYPNWINTKGYNGDISQQAYFAYLNSWYNANNRIDNTNNANNIKRQQYIQLIKDLLYLFNKDELDLFLSDIDFNNDEDLIYIIPYLANKLKQISQLLSEKREELKKVKIKDQLIGSQDGLEKILYEYILKNFTNKPYTWTRVPISPLANRFPQLSSIGNDFYIEIEELYDTNNYHDSDPSVPITEYIDFNKLLKTEPYASLSDDELTGLITSRLLLRVAPTPLSEVFNQYLTISPQLSTTGLLPLSASYTASIYNQIAASQKYLGESVYGLTAIRSDQLNLTDYTLSLPFAQGNNWFYWPSGDKASDPSTVGNIYAPISINNSNLVLNRTVSGSSYLDSDLIFTDKDGILEGAWLQGYRQEVSHDKMSIGLKSNDKNDFIFPFVGFNINSKDLSFKSYSLNDSNNLLYQKLSPQIRSSILKSYYNNVLPNSAVYDMYLNQTSLVKSGANAGYFSDDSDTITVTPSSRNYFTWSDSIGGNVESAYLYKFEKTDIFIRNDVNDIHWPIESYIGGTDNITLSLSADTCIPIQLQSIDPSNAMIGAIAGQSFNSSDVIYKLASNGGVPIEAAWLGSGSITQLDQTKNAIRVYQTSAVNCAQFIDGPIEPSLSINMPAGTFNSFIWMDEDTPADQVFYYYEHATNCPYGNSFPHDFYKDQDYQNPTPLNGGKKFPLIEHPCTCRAVNYSPIGTQGDKPTDYNSMGDMLFADPQGLGVDFAFNTWKDTRNFKPFNSPQFAFYKIDGTLDQEVGFGTGKWVNGDKTQMILKTGRRYTYYRSNLRINSSSSTVAPYLLVNYGYKNIPLTCGPNFSDYVDLVIVIDNSRTQSYDIDIVKSIAKNICETTFKTNNNVLISIISFSQHGLVLNYLTNDIASLIGSIDSIKTPKTYPEWLTNIIDGLILANNVLFTNQPVGNNCNYGDISYLCSGLNQKVINQSNIATITNCPRRDARKKILIFSDGQETLNKGTSVPYAELLKQNGVDIIAVDIGYYALTDRILEQMASDNMYYNLEEYLLYSDANLDVFSSNLTTLTIVCFPSYPTWCKAIRDSSGNWTGINTPSDMLLNAGDYLSYVHQTQTSYVAQNSFGSFNIPAISFTINVKLDGWSYEDSFFNLLNKGDGFGGKPFWGKTNTPSATSFPIAGGGRLMDDYVLLHQPEVSNMILKNGMYISYKNTKNEPFRWNEDLTFTVTLSNQQWNKLLISKTDSNLSVNLNTINVQDVIIDQTNDPSDLMLESYSSLNPAKYNFYLAPTNTPFTYVEDLFYINRCNATFVTFITGQVLDVTEPYLNLNNVNYPTIANIAFPSTFVTESQIGNYLLPDRLGVPYYRGKGYLMELDPTSITYLDSISAERMFLDIDKYASRNRGLTKKDQNTPIRIKNIDNRWMIEPFGSGDYSGTIVETINNQKFIPYQSNYEINKDNQIGISLQRDDFQFWNPDFFNTWNDAKKYPLTFRNELIFQNFLNKLDTLLTDIGIQSEWKTDIYGNNFGLFKDYGNATSHYLLTESGEKITTEVGLRFESQ
jgi:hypothetical protein